MSARIITGDCREVMATLAENSVDSIVTDPPYGLSFMGKGWDHGVPGVEFWTEALRVLKPGGHMLAFGGTRTYHRLVCAIEDAGFEIRDRVLTLNGEEHYPVWVYGSGFPKSLDVSKAIDKAAGADREVIGKSDRVTPRGPRTGAGFAPGGQFRWGDTHYEWDDLPQNGRDYFAAKAASRGDISAPATDASRQWAGWGTALKPAHEPICVARKHLNGTVAANVLTWGTGAINVDGCRVGTESTRRSVNGGEAGRWPANVIHDGSPEVVAGFPYTNSGTLSPDMDVKLSTGWSGGSRSNRVKSTFMANEGSASRFFYCAKASKKDRGEGNNHPTVKPTDLMRYLCRLVTPPGGLVLDPFCGSGSTGKAAVVEGFRFIGIEISPEYATIAAARIEAVTPKTATKSDPKIPEDAAQMSLF